MAILSSAIVSWLVQKKPDLSMIINGALAELVAITAPCAFVSVGSSAIIGLIAWVLGVLTGLDLGEHGMKAYPDFQGFLTK